MKWIKVNSTQSNEAFELWSEDQKLALIEFSKNTQMARMDSNAGRRIFFFEKKGMLTHRAIIKNEYGIHMGKVEEERPGSGKGHLELDGKRYHYQFSQTDHAELKLFEDENQRELLTCNFNAFHTGFIKIRSLFDTKIPNLVLALCWYLVQPHAAARAGP
ncbi:MAG: hypothetical protein IPI66_05290 [Chitinophagaceae bacterium]|nr:hypothetical protein [Chitinophagaceae bacterium]